MRPCYCSHPRGQQWKFYRYDALKGACCPRLVWTLYHGHYRDFLQQILLVFKLGINNWLYKARNTHGHLLCCGGKYCLNKVKHLVWSGDKSRQKYWHVVSGKLWTKTFYNICVFLLELYNFAWGFSTIYTENLSKIYIEIHESTIYTFV